MWTRREWMLLGVCGLAGCASQQTAELEGDPYGRAYRHRPAPGPGGVAGSAGADIAAESMVLPQPHEFTGPAPSPVLGSPKPGAASAARITPLPPGPATKPTPSALIPGKVSPIAPAAPSSILRWPTTLTCVPRSRWAAAGPMTSRIDAMGPIERITLHHEGWDIVDFTDTKTTAQRLDSIRRSHLERLGAGDIGYHFVIDRAGRVWEGRSLRYQGAHVKNHNPNNLGIMVLGNFNMQSPSAQQLASLEATVKLLAKQYAVPASRLYTHRELGPTACPGNALQAPFERLRKAGRLT